LCTQVQFDAKKRSVYDLPWELRVSTYSQSRKTLHFPWFCASLEKTTASKT